MARVVQQRSGPPYFLIIVVLLFLVSTAVAIMEYMDADKKGTDLTEVSAEIDKLANPRERSSKEVAEMAKQYDEASGVKPTVVRQLSSQVKALTTIVTGQPTMAISAIQQDAALRDSLGLSVQRGLVTEVRRMKDQLDRKDQNIAGLQGTVRQKDTQLGAKAAVMDKLRAEMVAQIGELQKQKAAGDKKLQDEQTEHERLRGEAAKQHRAKVLELEGAIAQLGSDSQNLTKDNRRLQNQVELLKEIVKKYKDRIEGVRGYRITVNPMGKIMGDPSPDMVCYIDVGRKEGIKAGWTFAIYPRGGQVRRASRKGSLEVTRVKESISERRVTKALEGKTVVGGDVVSNIILGKSRTYTFVVEGDFDLHKMGKPSAAGAEEVKALISDFGGKLVDELSIHVDYVVLGQEPDPQVKPGEGASPQAIAAYEAAQAAYKRYVTVRAKAEEMRIPIVNSNAFLDMIGNVPTKRLQYK